MFVLITGLVSLNKISNASCFGCLTKEERKYADKSCTTYTIVENQKNKQSKFYSWLLSV